MNVTLEELAPSAQRIAYRRVQDGSDRDDMAQEALIAMWRQMEARPGHKGAYYRICGERRVADVADGSKPMFGGPGIQGGGSIAKSRQHEGLVRRRPTLVGTDDESFLESLAPTTTLDEDAEWVSYRPLLAKAINQLAPVDREYVVRMFWGGETSAAAAAELGVNVKRWHNIIKPALRTALVDIGDSMDE